MTWEKLAAKIRELLKVDHDLGFPTALKKDDPASLVTLIGDRLDRMSD